MACHRVRFLLMLSLLSAANFLMVFDGQVVTVALPAIERSMTLSALDAQWVLTAYSVPLGGMLLLAGRCGDRFGRRRILVAGLVIFAIGLVSAGLAPAPWLLFVARVIEGVGATLAIPNTFALISGVRSRALRQQAFAASAIAGSGASACGAVLGGLIVQTLGWRYVFFLSAPLALMAALCAPRLLAAGDDHARPPRLDGVAALLSTGGLALLVLAITNIGRAGLPMLAPLAFVLSVAFLSIFVFRERRACAPLVPSSLLRNRVLWVATSGVPGQVCAYTGTLFIGLQFLQQVGGYSPFRAGLGLTPLGVAAAIGSPLAGRYFDARKWARTATFSLLGCAVGLSFLATASPFHSYFTHVLPALLMIGFGLAGSTVTLSIAAGSEVSSGDQGVAYGTFETSTHCSTALTVAVLAAGASAGVRMSGSTNPLDALVVGYHVAFGVAAAGAIIAAIILAVLRRWLIGQVMSKA